MTSRPSDLLLTLDRASGRTLGRQIEDQLRAAIRAGTLRPGSRLPSTRDLATELQVSRPIVVDAYAQLAAEGFVRLRQGARPEVAALARPARAGAARPRAPVATRPRFDFRPGVPDLGAFPRSTWLRAVRDALSRMADLDFGYSDPLGSLTLREALSAYLGRVRGVVADPARVIVTSGFYQGRLLMSRALAAIGVTRVALEDPNLPELWAAVRGAGLEPVAVPVDGEGLVTSALARVDAGAVFLTPAHQYPTGGVLSGERRAALMAWLRDRNAFALEDDYDAEFRYDRAPVGALQALDPERIVYAGTTSKTLAPGLRLGWLVAPTRLTGPLAEQQARADYGGPRIEQHAFALFLERGDLDRHLRRMRAAYRARRDTLVAAVRQHLPGVGVGGIAAGLHATLELPPGSDDRAVRDAALARGIALTALSDYALGGRALPPALIVGYARNSEPTIRAGVRELAAVIREAARPARRARP